MNIPIIIGCSLGAVVLILLLIILFGKLKISVTVNNNIIKAYVSGIKMYDSSNKKQPAKVLKKEESFEKNYKNFKYVINFVRKILDDKNDDLIYILKNAKKTLSVKKLDLSLDYGFGDAALTGITGGIIWGLISNICCFIGKYININEFTHVAVKPYYTEKILEYKINLVFTVRILYLLKTAKHVRRFKNTLKGGK